jgi:hypothetical protein
MSVEKYHAKPTTSLPLNYRESDFFVVPEASAIGNRYGRKHIQPQEVTMKRVEVRQAGKSAGKQISKHRETQGDWRSEMLSQIRALIKMADPHILEERKWMGTPVWSHDGIVCTGETYKSVVKMTFAKGASLKDPLHLFNSSLNGNVRRAIDFREGEKINVPALKALIREAVALNVAGKKARTPISKAKRSLVRKSTK